MTLFAPAAVDRDLLGSFRDQAIGPDEWNHEMHVRIGWLHVKRFGPENALERLRTGLRVATIARELTISPNTVRNHLKSIYRKLGVRSQTELLEQLRGSACSAAAPPELRTLDAA